MIDIKKNFFIQKIYEKARKIMTLVSPRLASIMMYKISIGKKLNLRNPIDFNQKIMWLKLNTYNQNSLITQCVDKFAVRDYIKSKKCDEILNNLIGVYESTKEIDWEKLPQKFALKCNHGCGMNIICANKDELDKNKTFAQLEQWMSIDYYLDYAEINYKDVKKKIICEDYLGAAKGELPNDYKIYCFDGVPQIILVCHDRAAGVKLAFYDLQWQSVPLGKLADNQEQSLQRPNSLDKMLEYSRTLSKGFPFVRIDFYDFGGQVFFGEMTFTPAGGMAKYYSDYGQEYLGNLIKLPKN